MARWPRIRDALFEVLGEPCPCPARVALARKLAVILHRMPITGEPFRRPEKAAAATA